VEHGEEASAMLHMLTEWTYDQILPDQRMPQIASPSTSRHGRGAKMAGVVGRRYQTGLLWKDDYAVLPRSYEMAHRRLINVEKKLKRNGQLALEYDRIINDYVSKGYAMKLQQDEVAVTSDRHLPHFGVENPNKPGKVRLMFDAAAKVGGTSLNSGQGASVLQALASRALPLQGRSSRSLR